MVRALITGITGQDGSYLAEYLLSRNYEVHGVIRRSSSFNTQRIDHIYDDIYLHFGDMTDGSRLSSLVSEIQPDEIYNLAAQSHVQVSFEMPDFTGQVDALGALRLLESVRSLKENKEIKLYHASTSELYGWAQETPQSESTPFYPRSPYGVAKLYAYWITKNYREAYGIKACTGILFNHESPRRGPTFVTKKVVAGLNKIARGELDCLELGNLNALRDWGHAKDFVEAMYLMLQASEMRDYVVATGEQYSVRDFVSRAASRFGFDIIWNGSGVDEVGIDSISGRTIVRVNRRYFRPTEVDSLLGDSSLIRSELGWKPKYTFDDLLEEMCSYELSK